MLFVSRNCVTSYSKRKPGSSKWVLFHPPGLLLTPLPTVRTVLTEIEEIRSGLWDERIKASLGIVSPEPTHDTPAVQEVAEVEEPTNEIEDVSMADPEHPGQQDDPIIIDDSDATVDEPLVAQQVSQALEEEEVDLHLTPDSIAPSPKPTEGVNNEEEQAEITNEEPSQPVEKEPEPPSPFTEQDPREQDAEGLISSTLFSSLTHPGNS
jgi:bromodomain-containing protein 8